MLRLKFERLLKELSQAKLSSIIGTNQTAIYRIERGVVPQPEIAQKLEEFFELPIAELLKKVVLIEKKYWTPFL